VRQPFCAADIEQMALGLVAQIGHSCVLARWPAHPERAECEDHRRWRFRREVGQRRGGRVSTKRS
jgi:hypothetical protein